MDDDTTSELTSLIQDTEQAVAETQEIGENTLTQLDQQNNQFSKTHERARELHDFTLETSSKIKEISGRRARRRSILWAIIIFQLLIILSLYYRYRRISGSQ